MNKCTWDRVSALSVFLPTAPDGQPDWDYMDSYMKIQMEKAEILAEHLEGLVKN